MTIRSFPGWRWADLAFCCGGRCAADCVWTVKPLAPGVVLREVRDAQSFTRRSVRTSPGHGTAETAHGPGLWRQGRLLIAGCVSLQIRFCGHPSRSDLQQSVRDRMKAQMRFESIVNETVRDITDWTEFEIASLTCRLRDMCCWKGSVSSRVTLKSAFTPVQYSIAR